MRERFEKPGPQGFLERLRHYVFADLGLKALALLISVVLWLSVAGQTRLLKVVTLHNVDIALDELPPNLAVTSNEPAQASVSITGPEDIVREIRIGAATRTSDLIAYARLSGASEGVYLFPLKLRGLPPGIEDKNVRIEPESVRVTLEPIGTREVVVEPRFVGTLPPDYKQQAARVEPRSVLVRGPESLIQRIDKLATTTINLNGRMGTFTERVDVDITEADVVAVPNEVQVTVTVEEESGTRTFESVPVTLPGGEPAPTEPSTISVTVKGPMNLLKLMSPSEIAVTVDPTGEPRNRPVLTPQVVVTGPAASRLEVVSAQPRVVRLRR